jgi:hypothetical protein
MFAILHAIGMLLAGFFKSRARLEAEILLLWHQLNVALRHAPPRVLLHRGARAFMIWMVRFRPSLLHVDQVVQPETVLRLAPGWVPCLLALEVAKAGRAAKD